MAISRLYGWRLQYLKLFAYSFQSTTPWSIGLLGIQLFGLNTVSCSSSRSSCFNRNTLWCVIHLCDPASMLFSTSAAWILLFTVKQQPIWSRIWEWKERPQYQLEYSFHLSFWQLGLQWTYAATTVSFHVWSANQRCPENVGGKPKNYTKSVTLKTLDS